KLREARRELALIKLLMGQAIGFGRAESAGEKGAARLTEVKPAGEIEKLDLCGALQLVPELVGAAEQGDVVRVLVVAQADHAGLAVRTALGVRDLVLLEAEHARAAAGQGVRGRASHRPQPNDDDIVAVAHGSFGKRHVRVNPTPSSCSY